MRDAGREVSPRAHLIPGVTLAGAAGLAVATSAVVFGTGSLLNTDGRFFLEITRRLTDLRDPAVELATYRMSRPLFPAAAWLVSGGQAGAATLALSSVYIASFFGIGYLSSRLAGSPLPAWLLLACPALWLTVPDLVAEPMVVLLILLTYFVARRRRGLAPAVGALAMLTKESAAVALFPLAFRALRDRRYNEAIAWVASGIPLVAWWIVLRQWTGRWPWQDSPGPGEGALGLPFMGMVEAIPGQWALAASGKSDAMPWVISSMVLALATLIAALVGLYRDRASMLWQAAAWSALLIISASLSTWAHPGEAIRLLLPAQILLIVAWYRGRAEPSPLDPSSA